MPTTEQFQARLQYQVGETRARMVAERLRQSNWHGHEISQLVIMRSDLDGFREWIGEMTTGGEDPQRPLDFLRRSIALLRHLTVEYGGLFERQHGDRTTAIFAKESLLPGDEPSHSDPWTRAVACGVLVLREYSALARKWGREYALSPPALRLGVTGISNPSGVGRVVNAVETPHIHPPEIFSVGYEQANGTLRCLHSIADGLCEIAANQSGWMNIHRNLNDSSAKEAEALWRGIVRGRQDGMLLIDHTNATPDFLPRIESELAQDHPLLSEFSFIQPSIWAWDPKNGDRRVALAQIDKQIDEEFQAGTSSASDVQRF